jgi:hypothetical protein
MLIFPPGSVPFKILALYNHPGSRVPPQLIKDFFNLCFNGKALPGFVLGDLNSPDSAYGSRTSNASEIHLENIVDDQNLTE